MKQARARIPPEFAAPPLLRVLRADDQVLPAELWTIEEAARALRVGVTYLRRSDCPRIYLPSVEKHSKRPPVRFDPITTMRWAREGRTDR
jgi:hypothetical protein